VLETEFGSAQGVVKNFDACLCVSGVPGLSAIHCYASVLGPSYIMRSTCPILADGDIAVIMDHRASFMSGIKICEQTCMFS